MKKIKDGNFKVKCLNNGDDIGLTVGKIYEFKDGYSQWDDGEKLPQFESCGISRFSNFEDLKKWFDSVEYDEDDEYAYKFKLISEELENSDSELDYTKSPSIHIYPNKKNPAQTIAILKFGNEITDRVISRCHPDDYYDFKKGAEVAFNRLFNLDADNDESDKLNNDNITNSNSGSNDNDDNKVKKVKRLAKPGEYVIITNASVDDPYKNGDILKIVENKDYSFGLTARYGDSNGQFLYDNEYLVLENYDPKLILDYSYNKGNLSKFSDNELIEELKKRLGK